MPFLWLLLSLFGQGAYVAKDNFTSSYEKEMIACFDEWWFSDRSMETTRRINKKEEAIRIKYGKK